MQVSLRSLLLFVAATCIALTLSQMEFVRSAYVLIAIVVLANITLSKHAWRCAAYGALTGMLLCFLVMQVYIFAKVGSILPSNYTQSDAIHQVMGNWRSYVIHLGALVGGTLGFILFGNQMKTESNSHSSDSAPEA